MELMRITRKFRKKKCIENAYFSEKNAKFD